MRCQSRWQCSATLGLILVMTLLHREGQLTQDHLPTLRMPWKLAACPSDEADPPTAVTLSLGQPVAPDEGGAEGRDSAWGPKEGLRRQLQEFAEVWAQRPPELQRQNKGGMRFPHQFAVWTTIRLLRPTVVIESGVHNGAGTWVIRQAAPAARIISIDPRRALGPPTFTTSNQELLILEEFRDFAELGSRWKDESLYPKDTSLVIFDDHQSGLRRLRQAQRFGFKHLLFEDNHPTATGDCYSLKQILDASGRGYGALPRRYPADRTDLSGLDLLRERVLAQDNFARTEQVRQCPASLINWPPCAACASCAAWMTCPHARPWLMLT